MSTLKTRIFYVLFLVTLTSHFGCAHIRSEKEQKKISQWKEILENQTKIFVAWDLSHQKNLVCSDQKDLIPSYRLRRDAVLQTSLTIKTSGELSAHTKSLSLLVEEESLKEKPCLQK